MPNATANAALIFTHVRVAPRKGYNVVNTQTNEVVSHHLGDGRSIHAGRTQAIRAAKALNERTAG